MNKFIVKYLKYRWKKLGYKFRFSTRDCNLIILDYLYSKNSSCHYFIKIDLQFCEFWKSFSDGDLMYFTYYENLLITETFRLLGCKYE